MKQDYRKQFREYYTPPENPVRIRLPAFRFFMIEGAGNPNAAPFADDVGALYSLSYAIKMMPKGGFIPEGYFEYTVFPLEGVWDLDISAGPPAESSPLDKDRLVYTMMIRQPDFVDSILAARALEVARAKKLESGQREALGRVRFGEFEEGDCVQILHIGAYDDEPLSFGRMARFCEEEGLRRIGHRHREIYLSDPARTAPAKLKTVLRWTVEPA